MDFSNSLSFIGGGWGFNHCLSDNFRALIILPYWSWWGGFY